MFAWILLQWWCGKMSVRPYVNLSEDWSEGSVEVVRRRSTILVVERKNMFVLLLPGHLLLCTTTQPPTIYRVCSSSTLVPLCVDREEMGKQTHFLHYSLALISR